MSDLVKTAVALGAITHISEQSKKLKDSESQLSEKNSENRNLKDHIQELESELDFYKARAIPDYAKVEQERRAEIAKELENEIAHYKNILSLPLAKLVETGYSDYKTAYAEQRQIMSQFVIENKAIKELCHEYGLQLSKSVDEMNEDYENAQDRVLNQESEFGNNVTDEELDELMLFERLKAEMEESSKASQAILDSMTQRILGHDSDDEKVKYIKPNM